MWTAIKSVAKSAPVWAWILMVVCLVAIVVGLVVVSNRTAHVSALDTGLAPVTSVVSIA